MAHIPIDLPDQSIHIHAQRELAFEVLSAFGMGAKNGGPSNVVLREDGQRKLIEFHVPMKFGPMSTTWISTEWVTPEKPGSIDFEMIPAHGVVKGGLRELKDRFVLEAQGNCTVMTYKSRFGIRWSVGGWVLGKVLFGPMLKKHMIEHLGEVKEMIENRASRSRVYPQLPCDEGD